MLYKNLLYFAISVFLSLGINLLGQDATGRVIGTVTDPTGAAIAGAKVIVTNTATQVPRETVTDNEGNYQVLEVPIGS